MYVEHRHRLCVQPRNEGDRFAMHEREMAGGQRRPMRVAMRRGIEQRIDVRPVGLATRESIGEHSSDFAGHLSLTGWRLRSHFGNHRCRIYSGRGDRRTVSRLVVACRLCVLRRVSQAMTFQSHRTSWAVVAEVRGDLHRADERMLIERFAAFHLYHPRRFDRDRR